MPELTTIADERSPRDEYVERGGRIYHKPRRSRHWRLVANFVARVEDEGVRDGVRYAKVTAVLQDKRTLTVSMPATEFARMRWVIPQGLRISLGCLGAPGMSDLPLLSSPASWESDGFCTIDHQENSTSSGTSTP
jgi:hypothetical protein